MLIMGLRKYFDYLGENHTMRGSLGNETSTVPCWEKNAVEQRLYA